MIQAVLTNIQNAVWLLSDYLAIPETLWYVV